MNNAPFVTLVSRGLVKGAKCLIDGREFASTDPKQSAQHWEDACNHALALVREQDTVDGVYQPNASRSLQNRQSLYRASQQ